MEEEELVLKDEEKQRPIPSAWREKIAELVEAISRGDYQFSSVREGVKPVPEVNANSIARNIANYGAGILPLSEDTWRTSVCQWMRGYWDALVDLHTEEEGASDLVLALRVFESDGSYMFEVKSVYVP
jgi:hypothetical protein